MKKVEVIESRISPEGVLEVLASDIPSRKSLSDICRDVCVRAGGNMKGRAIWLPTSYQYELAEDSDGFVVLVAICKKK